MSQLKSVFYYNWMTHIIKKKIILNKNNYSDLY